MSENADSLVSVETTPDVEDHWKEVLQGNLLVEHRPKSCTVRLFVSSDPQDSVWERCLFDQYVLPRLKHHCESLGLHFHLVNLEPVHDSPREMIRTRELSLKEVKLSQQLSIGPSFVSLLSHRYGWRATPSSISKEDFLLLSSCLASDDRHAHQLLLQWYILDENRMPPAYVYNWNALKSASRQSWEIFSRSLRKAAKILFGTREKSKVQLYTVSTSEEEVTAGIFNCGAAGSGEQGDKCCWFKRVFSDMHSQKANDPAMMSYCDVMCDRCDMDQEAQKTLAHLKEARMTAKHIGLENTNIFEFPIKWAKGCGLDPQNDPTHSEYLQNLLTTSTAFLQQKVSTAAEWYRDHSGPELYKEVLFHGHLCQEKARQFRVHGETLVKVQNYLNGSSAQPLVVSGLPGYGKSTLLAASARYLREKHSTRDMCIIIRFLGTTPQSANIRRTLQSVCQQLIAVYSSAGAEPSFTPTFHDYQNTVHTFHNLLASLPHTGKPVYLFLDAVDELSAEDGAYSMSWVPGTLPPHVKLVLSTSSSKNCSCFAALQGVLHNNRQQLFEVPPLDEQSAEALLFSLVEEAGRTLTSSQKAVAMATTLSCPMPLFLSLLAGKLEGLHHTDALLPRDMPHGLEEVVEEVLQAVEHVCGQVVVERALALICCAKSGLTEAEMMDLLSLDEEVVACTRGVSIISSSSGSGGRNLVPSLLWSHLLHSLLPSLLEFRRGEGDLLVLNLKHSVLRKVVHERYLQSEEKRWRCFNHLSGYFSGKLQGGSLAQEEGQEEGHQEVAECVDTSDEAGDNTCSTALENCLGDRGSPFLRQPLWLGPDSCLNCQKLMELPHALAQEGQVHMLKELLCSLQWQQAVITGFSSSDLVAEFSNLVPVVPENKDQAVNSVELRIVREALRLSAAALSLSPKLLPQQLIGRLLPFVSDTSVYRPLVSSLYQEAVTDITAPAIIPQQHLAETPDGPLLATLEGHRGPVSGVVCTLVSGLAGPKQGAPLLVTCSHDGTLKTWDLVSLGVVQTLQAHKGAVLAVAATEDGRRAVSGGLDGTVRLWDLKAGLLLQTMVGHSEKVAAVALTGNGEKALSASADGTIKVWSTDVQSRHCGELIFTLSGSGGVPLSVLVMVKGGHGRWFMCGDCEGNLLLWDLVSGVAVQKVAAHEAEVTAAEALWQREEARPSDRGPRLGAMRVVSAARDLTLKLWDFPSGTCLHCVQLATVVTCLSTTDVDIFIAGAQDGSLSVWELDSFAPAYSLPKHSHQAVLGAAAVRDGWLAVSAGEEGQVKIWDLLTRPLSTRPAHSGHVTCTRFSVCGSMVASGGQDGAVLVHTFTIGSKMFEKALALGGPVTGLAPFRDNKRLAVSSSDGMVRIWDGESSGDVLELRGREGEVAAFTSVTVSWSGDYIAAGDVSGRVTVWESGSGRRLKTLHDRSQAVMAVTFCENDSYQLLVSGDVEGTVCIRNLHDASFIQTIHLHIVGGVTCLRPQPGGSSIIVASSQDPQVSLWSLPDGVLLSSVDCSSTVNDVAVFSIKGSLHLLTACSDHTLQLWEMKERALKAVLPTDYLPRCCDVGSDGESVVAVYGDSMGNVATAEVCLEGVPDSFKEHFEGLKHQYPHATPSPCEVEGTGQDSTSIIPNEEDQCGAQSSAPTSSSPPVGHHSPAHDLPNQNGYHHEGVHDGDYSPSASPVMHTEAPPPASYTEASSSPTETKDGSPTDANWDSEKKSHLDLEEGAGEGRDVDPKTGEQVVHSKESDSLAERSSNTSVAKATVLSKSEDKQFQEQQTSSVCILL